MDVGGVLVAVLAAIFNGTFGIFSKMRSVQEAQVPSPIFNFWTCVGIVISSSVFLAAGKVFTPWGILSGALFVMSMASTLFAIQDLGLSTASGVWSGTAVVVSFTFGVKVMGDTIQRPGLAAPGLMLLVAGISGIALNGQVAARRHKDEEIEQEAHETDEHTESGADASLLRSATAKHRRTSTSLTGLMCAVLAGFFGGLVLAPMNFAPEQAKGLAFVPSMGLGALISAPIVTLVFIALHQAPLRLYVKEAALPGILAGIIWNAGNVCSIIATQNPNVGLSIAYPIMQAGLFFAGLWGICLFHELTGREQVGYWLSSIILISGVFLLATSK